MKPKVYQKIKEGFIWQRNDEELQDIICYECEISRHMWTKCPKLKRNPKFS